MSARSLKNGVLLSLSAIANAWGCARETAKKRIDAGGVEAAELRRGHPVYLLKDVVQAFEQPEDFDPDKLEPFQRKAFYQAEREKLNLEVERGTLLGYIEVERESARVFEIIGRFLDTLPDVLERDTAMSAPQVQKLDELIDRVREELYEEVTSGAERSADAAG